MMHTWHFNGQVNNADQLNGDSKRIVSDWTNPYVSPLLSSDSNALPPALIITAKNDILKNDGKVYAQKLMDADVPTVYSCYAGVVHGFVAMKHFKSHSERALEGISSTLRKTL